MKSQATHLVELGRRAELFRSPQGEAFATIDLGARRETWPLRGKQVRQFLQREHHRELGSVPSAQALQDALSTLEGQAQFDSPELPVFTRLAEHRGAIYLDLADDEWHAAEVTATGFRVVTDPPVKFRRTRGMKALPVPVAGGSIGELSGFLNASDDDLTLLVAWGVQALRPSGPYPPLLLHGEQGSAKSTTAKIARSLIDPNAASLRAEPRDVRDLMIAARNGWVIALDNMSTLPGWLSDAACRLATGGGLATRELYSDAEEIIFDAQRPVILNGIEELATRGDLLDRSLVMYLPPIAEHKRRSEREFWQGFAQAQPRILGALLHAVSTALANVGTVRLMAKPRMADFAEWVVAAEPALDWPAGAFLGSYARNRESANEVGLEASPIAPYLRQLAEAGFEGSASELLEELSRLAGENERRTWPTTPRALSGQLRRLTPNLRQAGVDVEFLERTAGRRPIRIGSDARHDGNGRSQMGERERRVLAEVERLKAEGVLVELPPGGDG